MEAAQTKPVEASIGISISVNLGKNHAITLQSYVARDDEDPKPLIDKMVRQADRLIARYEAKELRRNLELNEVQLKSLVGDVARIDAQHVAEWERNKGDRRGDFKPSPKQQAEKTNVLTTKSKFEAEIARLKKHVEELEKEAE